LIVQAGSNTFKIKHPTKRPPIAAAWLALSIILGLLLAVPLFLVVVKMFLPGSAAWQHIVQNLLFEYSINTILLCFFTSTLALLLGVSCAWLISRFDFPGKKWLEWALILPLALPSYIVAYSYAGILSYTGPFYSFIRQFGSEALAQSLYVDSMNLGTLSVILAVVLFPYVYLPAKAAFQLQSASIFEAADSLSINVTRNFFRIALPLARPAIAGGLFLVLMEVLNDYGAVKYFGINTFTTGIFKAWFSMNDLDAAIKLAAVLMLFVGLLFLVEKKLQRSSFAASTGLQRVNARKILGPKKWLLFAVCFLPFLLGFAFPFLKILNDARLTWSKVFDAGFYQTILNSIGLAAIAALLIVGLSLLFIYSSRLNKSIAGVIVKRTVSLGYALPGAVIAVGVMVVAGMADSFIETGLGHVGVQITKLIITGSVIGIMYAYLIRFMAVSVNPLEGNFEQQCSNLDEASRSLGKSNWYTLTRVNIPVLRPAILSAMLLVFVDVMKELPLTLILRPFNFDTLATKAYEFANDEMLRESASASLLIVLSGIVPILLIHKLIKKV
jgi:iron(III) transport system permease protein